MQIAPRPSDPQTLILWLDSYRRKKLRLSVCALAADMTREGYPMNCRTLTHVFAHAEERKAGRTSVRGQPRDVTVAIIEDYCQHLRDKTKRKLAARKRRAAAPDTTATV